jgi:telomerase reverse transcriptase
MQPHRLGSAMFSVNDMHSKIKAFKIEKLHKPLYFAKVDVTSAFDTIPQSAIMSLMPSLLREPGYRISKYVEIKPGEGKPAHKWRSNAEAPSNLATFDQNLETSLAVGKKNTIFVENVVNQLRSKDGLLNLLAEHIQYNMVKIGKRFYRQKSGIPQGSIVSSMLCNYFYADLECRHLGFLKSGDSLLMRLIDDFLLITTDRHQASRFLQTMHDGLPEYGVSINPDKTLTNFEVVINDRKVARLLGSRRFPYCGNFIDTKTLDLIKGEKYSSE